MIRIFYNHNKERAELHIEKAFVLGKKGETLFNYDINESEGDLIKDKLFTTVENSNFYQVGSSFKEKVKDTVYLIKYIWR